MPANSRSVLKKVSEYILCAAVHYDDGKVYEHQPRNIKTGIVIAGRRHHNCLLTGFILAKGKLKKADQVQGFLTNTDRFVNREEAFCIAKAADQLLYKCEGDGPQSLISEDLW